MTDREITTADQDCFDFQDYAEVLAKRIGQTGTPIAIGVFGSWGTGKTSLMRLIQEQLGESYKTVKLLWINVWQLSNQEEIWSAFLQALLTKVHGELPRFRRWIFDWTLFRERVKWGDLIRTLIENGYRIVISITPILLAVFWPDQKVSNTNELLAFALNPLVGGSASLFLGLWLLIRPGVKAAREKVSLDLSTVLKDVPYEIKISELQKLEQQFGRMVQAWVGKEGRLAIFIDDLDRCTPPKIPELLEALKLFTTTPGCIYVLGLDYDIVRKGIRKRYEFDDQEAEEYLEKIIQVPFHLPPLDEGKIEDFVKVNLHDLVARCPAAAQVFAKGVEPNPRKLKRCINVYRTVLDLADKRVDVWEMDPVDDELVAKIVVLQSRFRKLHKYVSQKPDELRSIDAAKGKILHNEDDPIRATLLGEDEDTRLVKSDEIEPLVALLEAGDKHFNDPDQKEKTSSYIYLIATAEDAATGVRPNPQEREALLGGDLERIKAQVEDIQQRGGGKVYISRLKGVLADRVRYTQSEGTSAKIALYLLEGLWTEEYEPITVRVPAGPFLMGSSDSDYGAGVDEKPQHQVELSEYRIGKYPVTNAEYWIFVKQSPHPPPGDWDGEDYPEGEGDHPVTNVTWHAAVAYCDWLSSETGRKYRLPNEAEWEKAARGMDGRIYPWGNEFDPARCNTREGGAGDMTPVGQYSPRGDSPYGCVDMAGNVCGWTRSIFRDYPYVPDDRREDLEAFGPRVLRGGSWLNIRSFARCAARGRHHPDVMNYYLGFRVVVSPSNSGL